ncbi:hypothetical protein GUJ93_ZPchr0002g26743 [Zizania palustris]|uniref:Uncharacterized protein n=1 Tax=Zizania palustris TaxID=103762 RepID=A0A8J5S5U8_ZIZPA|nr:hypothetical protein GUJ93_ZPchr0002g26743 [Zizania palustris]
MFLFTDLRWPAANIPPPFFHFGGAYPTLPLLRLCSAWPLAPTVTAESRLHVPSRHQFWPRMRQSLLDPGSPSGEGSWAALGSGAIFRVEAKVGDGAAVIGGGGLANVGGSRDNLRCRWDGLHTKRQRKHNDNGEDELSTLASGREELWWPAGFNKLGIRWDGGYGGKRCV